MRIWLQFISSAMGLMLLLFVSPLFLYSQTINIIEVYGKVFLPNGQPASQIQVYIASEIGTLSSSITDDQGSFRFIGLPKTLLTVTVTVPSNAHYYADPVIIDSTRMGTVFPANFFLRNPLQENVNQQKKGKLISVKEMSQQIPKEAKKALARARKFRDQKKNEDALRELDKATEISPEYFQAFAEKGTVQIQSRQFEAALKNFEKALEILPEYEPALSGAGYCLLSIDKYEQSVSFLEKAARLDPANARTLLFLGISNLALSRWQQAQEVLQRALSTNPGQVSSARMYLANAYAGQNQFRQAADELHTYLEQNPNDPNASRLRIREKYWRSQIH